MDWITATVDGVQLAVRLTPRGAHNAIEGVRNGALQVRVTAPPVDGRANAAMVRLLTGQLHIAANQIRVTAGAAARTKRVRVQGLDCSTVLRRLGVVDPDAR